jgi:hypothetical protein
MIDAANQQNVIQGSYATEDINYIHRTFEERLLEAFANLVRNGLRTNDHIRTYLLDELGIAELEIDEKLLDLAEIFVKVTSDLDDMQDISIMKNLIHAMIQTQMVDFHDVAMLQFAKEPSAILNLSREVKEKTEKANKQKQDKEFELQQQQIDIQKQIAEKQDEYKKEEFRLKELQIRLSADQFRLQSDADDNRVPDSVQKAVVDNEYNMEKLQYETTENKEIRLKELELELEKLRSDIKLREKELKLKEMDINLKSKQKQSLN